jgi:hypothetical protein
LKHFAKIQFIATMKGGPYGRTLSGMTTQGTILLFDDP